MIPALRPRYQTPIQYSVAVKSVAAKLRVRQLTFPLALIVKKTLGCCLRIVIP